MTYRSNMRGEACRFTISNGRIVEHSGHLIWSHSTSGIWRSTLLVRQSLQTVGSWLHSRVSFWLGKFSNLSVSTQVIHSIDGDFHPPPSKYCSSMFGTGDASATIELWIILAKGSLPKRPLNQFAMFTFSPSLTSRSSWTSCWRSWTLVALLGMPLW